MPLKCHHTSLKNEWKIEEPAASSLGVRGLSFARSENSVLGSWDGFFYGLEGASKASCSCLQQGMPGGQEGEGGAVL